MNGAYLLMRNQFLIIDCMVKIYVYNSFGYYYEINIKSKHYNFILLLFCFFTLKNKN